MVAQDYRVAKWTNIKVGLPANGQHCLIANDSYSGGVLSGFFSHGKFYDSLGSSADDYKPCTHWMPLPEPPTKEPRP